jgi:urease gamma subunit
MASKKRQTVDTWVQSVISEVIDGKGCSAITLLHLKGVGGATEEVTTKPIEGTVTPTELANFLIGRAEGFSQDLAGLQTFKLLAFYGSNEPHNPFHFTTSDGTVMSRSETMMSAHEPTPTGLLGQLMKHLENKEFQNNQLVASNMALAQSVITMCFGPAGVVQGSIKAQLEAVEVVKDAMLDMSRERKSLILEEHKAAQDLQTRKAVIEAIPQLVNRFTGHEIFDEKTNDSKIIEALALKISPQDLELLVGMGKLTREQALILSARFTSIVEEKRKEAEAIVKVPSEEGIGKAIVTAKGNGGL